MGLNQMPGVQHGEEPAHPSACSPLSDAAGAPVGTTWGDVAEKLTAGIFSSWMMAQHLSLGGQPSASPPWAGSYLCWELQCCTSTEGEQHLQLSKRGRGRLLPVPAEIGLLHFSSTSQPDPCTAPQPAGCTELLTDAQC